MFVTKLFILSLLIVSVTVSAQPSRESSQPAVASSLNANEDSIRMLRQEVEALKAGQALILKELAGLRSTLQARSGAPIAAPTMEGMAINIEGAPTLGRANARFTIIEFFDYECPYCAKHAKETLPQLIQHYVDSGLVRYVLMDFPIQSIHPRASRMAQIAHCGGDQGRYWEVHAALFSGQKKGRELDVVEISGGLGLDQEQMRRCLEEGMHSRKIRSGLSRGQQLGVRGTPTFVLGVADGTPASQRVLKVIRGAQPFPRFKQAIDEAIVAAKE